MSYIYVKRIERGDLSAKYSWDELCYDRVTVGVIGSTTIGELKRQVVQKWGIPTERHRYYGVSSFKSGKYQFHTEETILHHNDDDASIMDTLLNGSRRIEIWFMIAVVFLPAAAAPGIDDEVRMVRRVNAAEAVARRIEAGRGSAVEIADDSDGDDDEQRPPPPKRARQLKGEAEAGETAAATGEVRARRPSENRPAVSASRDEFGQSRSSSAGRARRLAGKNRPAASARDEFGQSRSSSSSAGGTAIADVNPAARAEDVNSDDNNQPAGSMEPPAENGSRRDDGGDDEGRNDANDEDESEALNGVADDAAGAVDAEAQQADGGAEEAEGDAPPQTSLRQWLGSLGANNGTPAGRFERYAPAFEDEFGSLEDLALAADNEPGGMEGILRDCGVDKRGDRARIRWAVEKLPRPR